jgi:hypothetical protein
MPNKNLTEIHPTPHLKKESNFTQVILNSGDANNKNNKIISNKTEIKISKNSNLKFIEKNPTNYYSNVLSRIENSTTQHQTKNNKTQSYENYFRHQF